MTSLVASFHLPGVETTSSEEFDDPTNKQMYYEIQSMLFIVTEHAGGY